MNTVFAIVRLFPYWGLVVALTFMEIGLHFYRRGKRGKMAGALVFALVFLALVSMWFLKRGDLNSGAWVKAWLGD